MSNLVTDKELLAICNLSNLKMEFADVAKTRDQQTNEILSNHTIYSLFEKEKEAILKDKNTKKERGFFKDLGNNETEETVNKDKIIYEKIEDLKKEAGIIYEYFEKYSFDIDNKMHPGSFTNDWEILYAGDTYKLLVDYFEFVEKENQSTYIFTFKERYKNLKSNNNIEIDENTLFNISYFRDIDSKKVLKVITLEDEEIEDIEKEDFFEASIAEEQLYTKLEEEAKKEKIYPTREEIEKNKNISKYISWVIKALGVTLTLMPLLRVSFRNIKTFKNGLTTVDGKTAKNIVQAKYGDTTPKTTNKSLSKKIRNVYERNRIEAKKAIQNQKPSNLIEAYKLYVKQNYTTSYNSFSLFFKNNEITPLLKDLLNDSKDLTTLSFSMATAVEKGLKEVANSTVQDIKRQIISPEAFLLKLKEEIEKKNKISNEYQSLYNEILLLIEKSKTTNMYESYFDFSAENFNILLLRKNDSLVICFKNEINLQELNKKYSDLNITNELLMMNLFNEIILKKYLNSTKYNITLTGFNSGAELATLYYYLNKNLNLTLNVFTSKELIFLKGKLIFSQKEVARALNFDYKNSSQVINEYAKAKVESLLIYGAGSLLIGIVSPPVALLSIGCILDYLTIEGLMLLGTIANNIFSNYRYEMFYTVMCSYGFFECQYKGNCNFNFDVCKIIKNETQEFKILSEKEINNILEREVEFIDFSKITGKIKLRTYLEYKFTSIKEYIDFKEQTKSNFKSNNFNKNKVKTSLNNYEKEKLMKEYPLLKLTFFSNTFFKTIYTYEYYILKIDNNKIELKKYKNTQTEYSCKSFDEKTTIMSYYTLKEEKVEETINESFEFLLWTLKLYSKFNENFRKNFDGKVVTIKGDFDSNTLKIYTQINKIQNNKFKDNFKLTEFNFLPYINESGVIETQANGETNYNHINNNYIGSVFRAVMESYYQTSIYNNYPKFREYPLDEKQSLYLLTKEGNKYYKKVNNFETSADLWLESYNKVYLNNFFVTKIENYNNNLIFSNKTINSLNEVVKKLKDKPTLLEKFYSLEDIKNSEEKIKEIKIGHLSNNTHNEKAYEYVYNKNDILKKGILILKATRPLFLKKEIENNASKTPLLNQATLICTAGSEYPKFVVTSNTNFKIQNLSVGLSSDKIGGKNIPAFGSCIFKKEGCKCPAISSEWSNQSEALLVNNQKLLTVASTISCDVGGTILVQENGTDITDKSIIK